MAEMTLERDEWMRRTGPLYPGLVALCHLTALPFPRGLEPTDHDVTRAAAWFPAVGALVGVLVAAVAWLLRIFGLVPGVAAIAAVILGVIATRAMLESGVAIVIQRAGRVRGSWMYRWSWQLDPDSSSRAAERESGLLSWSVVAVVCLLALRAATLLGTTHDSLRWWAALIIAHALGRWVLVLVAKLAVRPESETSALWSVGDISWKMFALASVAVVVPTILLAGLAGIAIVLTLATGAVGVGQWLRPRSRAMSDATLTAVACSFEIALLIGLAAVYPAVLSPWTI